MVIGKSLSKDGEVAKLLIRLQDGFEIESVIMKYHYRGAPQESPSSGLEFQSARYTLCVSSQVGCQMGCTFCATGEWLYAKIVALKFLGHSKPLQPSSPPPRAPPTLFSAGTMGLKADLTSGEIVEQLLHACRMFPIRNVVFMGMGEPLNNYAAVKSAIHLMTHPQVFALRRSSITVSTVGVIPRMKQLATELPGVSLALSLHAPSQELRSKIVPSARAYPLEKILLAMDAYQKLTQQRIFIEYVLLGPDINCTDAHARQLGELLFNFRSVVVINLIPWNPILSPTIDFVAPAPGATDTFHRILRHEYKLACTVRQEKGQDVAAACGQLVIEHEKTLNRQSSKPADIEDLTKKSMCSTDKSDLYHKLESIAV